MDSAIKLYNEISTKCSELVTKNYSTSFSLGIYTLNKRIHKDIYSIYGFVRFADEIVDTFHNLDKEKVLNKFEDETFISIKDNFSTNPILHAFQLTVNKFKIEEKHIKAFLESMRMDLYMKKFNEHEYKKYIYGSAEVVGLMCLKVFCSEEKSYNKLEPYAISLGSAFQKVNFLRDIRSDYDERGRVYFPSVEFESFTEEEKKKIEDDIEGEFNHALLGIKKLPAIARTGVYLSYNYYRELLNKIKRLDHKKIKSERIRVSNFKKFIIFLSTYLNPI
ncbi:MAG: phytoene/squalene synthase family protein [Bacteroidota bacterium]|nr:phytoene/squalene synthase family protein [Bacteroidota bacterium]